MPEARTFFNDAIELAEQGRYEEALDLVNKEIKIDSNNANAWYNRGIILYKDGKYQDALNSFGQAADIDPAFTDALYNKGITLMKIGKYNQAIRTFDAALKQNPGDLRVRTAGKQALAALLVKITPASPATDIQTRLVKEK
jgi:tetratricopeptide (TPR) repeat protein